MIPLLRIQHDCVVKPQKCIVCCCFSLAGEEEGAATATGVWKDRGVLEDDTTDDDSADDAAQRAPSRCVADGVRPSGVDSVAQRWLRVAGGW